MFVPKSNFFSHLILGTRPRTRSSAHPVTSARENPVLPSFSACDSRGHEDPAIHVLAALAIRDRDGCTALRGPPLPPRSVALFASSPALPPAMLFPRRPCPSARPLRMPPQLASPRLPGALDGRPLTGHCQGLGGCGGARCRVKPSGPSSLPGRRRKQPELLRSTHAGAPASCRYTHPWKRNATSAVNMSFSIFDIFSPKDHENFQDWSWEDE